MFGAMEPHSSHAGNKGLELVCHVSPNVPDAVLGDMTRLNQIITNLVSNAIKFTDNGEVFVEVRADSRSREDVVVHFSVRDSGIGCRLSPSFLVTLISK